MREFTPDVKVIQGFDQDVGPYEETPQLSPAEEHRQVAIDHAREHGTAALAEATQLLEWMAILKPATRRKEILTLLRQVNEEVDQL